jgi:cytochrome c
MKNPLDVGAGSADVEAGHELYTKKCEICHANGPHAPSIEAHTHHAPGRAGSQTSFAWRSE